MLVLLVLRECIWHAAAVSLVLQAFDVPGSLGNPPGSTLGVASRFLAENSEAELKPTTFSSLLLSPCFPVFPLLLIPHRYSTFECCLLGLLNNNNNNNFNFKQFIQKKVCTKC